MRRRQCKTCNKYNYKNSGEVIVKKFDPKGSLPGVRGVIPIRIYTVECSECGRKWSYRKKIKR